MTAFVIGTFLCWIAGAYLRKVYYVCATVWEILALYIFFIGSTVDDSGIFKILLLIMSILLICILILYEHQRRISDALNILIFIWTSIAESGILITKSRSTIASIAAVCGLIGSLKLGGDNPSKILFLMIGIEIVMTAIGCLIQILILEKKGIIKKKIFSKKWTTLVGVFTITIAAIEVAGLNMMSYESRNTELKISSNSEKPAITHKSKKDPQYYYAKGKVKVYSKADANSKCLGELADGQQVSYSDANIDDWVCIEYKNDQNAYVKKSEVSNTTPDERYFLDVTPAYGSGYYVPGQEVEIEYNGYLGEYTYFHKWSSNVDGILADPYTITTEVTMPQKDTWIEAVGSDWKPVKIQTESLKELLTNYTIKMNGESCKLLVLCYVFEQGDWRVNLDDVDDDDNIDVYTTDYPTSFKSWSSDAEIKCQLRDGTDGNKYVIGFFGNRDYNEKLQAEFPGGIILGQSTKEDVKKAYGENSYDAYGWCGDDSLGYWKEFGVGVTFGFDKDGRLNSFALKNDPKNITEK